ncbi:ABC transporter substrate-binding protein, partial [Nodularia sp. UHCC 0506]|uniref:ABC transporter substrate-binding protein n=1 Tax=Nodularia sp. UHCC 0506 TaxID=3110243 RepID=UPI002B1EF2B9
MKFTSFLSEIKRFYLPIILASITAITIAACNPSNFKSTAAQVPQLVNSILSDPKTFNYALSSEVPNIFGLTYEGLTNQNPITGDIEPILAESWEITDDKLGFIFTLRENLKWSDGQPLTVDDVVFTFNDIYLNAEIPSNIKDILRIGESRALPNVQ